MSAEMPDPTREEAAKRWHEALVQSGWLESCPMEETHIVDALGRVIVQPVVALRPVPHYAGSAMDGFAVRSMDTQDASPEQPIVLFIAPAGETLMPGTAVTVDTGDALPPGADSVLMKERASVRDGCIELHSPVLQGHHVRKIGEDIMTGETVLPAGRVVGPAEIAAALAVGAERVRIAAQPRIAVIPTGDEIVDSAEELPAGSIRDINSYMLTALFSSWGASVRRYPVVPDDPQLLRAAITGALTECDLVVTNGGTSAGTDDYTAEVFRDIGQMCCHGVAIRPGRPVVLAVVGGKPVIGLPGYPVSCMLTAELFLRDLLYEYQSADKPRRRTCRVKLAQEVRSKPEVEEYVRVKLIPGDEMDIACPLPRGASLISTLTQVDGWLRIGIGSYGLEADAIVEVELF